MKKILIIEDDAVTAHAYRTRLEKAGYEVVVAVDGKAGLEKIQQETPHGVLVDLMMPRMGGIELLKQVRALPQGATLPIIAFTNAFVPTMVEQARAAGATDVFSKSSVTNAMLNQAFGDPLAP